MRAVADANGGAPLLAHEAHDVLGTEAVAGTGNLGEALLLEVVEGLFHDRVDGLRDVRVVARGAVVEPLAKVKVLGTVERERVAVEDVGDDGVVSCKAGTQRLHSTRRRGICLPLAANWSAMSWLFCQMPITSGI